MMTKIQKWGNSLGLRIPKALAAEVALKTGSVVKLVARDGQLLVQPSKAREYRLDDLLSQIKRSNLHEEIEVGEPVGQESW